MPFRYRLLFMRRMPYRPRRNLKGFFIFCAILLILLALFTYLNHQLRPQVVQVIQRQMADRMNQAVHQEVLRCLEEEGVTYDALVEVEKGTDGSIRALRADTVKINALKAELSLGIGDKLRNLRAEKIRIPLGNLTPWQMLSGIGPRISVLFEPSGRVAVDFQSDFTSAGINQTRHRILLHATCKVSVLLPLFTCSTEYETDIPVAETVLVGEVPSAYLEPFKNLSD